MKISAVLALAFAIAGCAATSPVTPAAPLRVSGSEALAPAIHRWTDGCAATTRGAKFSITAYAQGASTAAFADLLAGKVDLIVTGRPLREEEAAAFVRKYGQGPVEIAVATGAPFSKLNRSVLGVVVHPDNPLHELTLVQLDAIFSAARRRGGPAALSRWGQLGLTGQWVDAPIHACIAEGDSGTAIYFRESVLKNAPLRAGLKELARVSDAVVRAVAEDPFAMGVTTLNFGTEGVRALALSEDGTTEYYAPTDANCATLHYPLTRQYLVYFNRARGEPSDPRIATLINFILGPRGQQLAVESEFLALLPEMIAAARTKLAARTHSDVP
jgi:phosphate transport system substrate-binding protein